MSTAPPKARRPVSTFTWALRVLWVLVAAVLVVAILVGIIRGTFYTGPAPAPESAPAPTRQGDDPALNGRR